LVLPESFLMLIAGLFAEERRNNPVRRERKDKFDAPNGDDDTYLFITTHQPRFFLGGIPTTIPTYDDHDSYEHNQYAHRLLRTTTPPLTRQGDGGPPPLPIIHLTTTATLHPNPTTPQLFSGSSPPRRPPLASPLLLRPTLAQTR